MTEKYNFLWLKNKGVLSLDWENRKSFFRNYNWTGKILEGWVKGVWEMRDCQCGWRISDGRREWNKAKPRGRFRSIMQATLQF